MQGRQKAFAPRTCIFVHAFLPFFSSWMQGETTYNGSLSHSNKNISNIFPFNPNVLNFSLFSWDSSSWSDALLTYKVYLLKKEALPD